MASSISMFPSITEDFLHKMKIQKTKPSFFYSDSDDEYALSAEPLEAASSLYYINDEHGIWDQDKNNLIFRRKYCLRNFQCLFGGNGAACHDAQLGLAIIWNSADSKQRGSIPITVFSADCKIAEAEAEHIFAKAQLRGEVEFTSVIYIASPGNALDSELHLANHSGYILGALDTFTAKLDGHSSLFPVFEINDPGAPLWDVNCDWIDPAADLLSDCVSINLNTAHKYYKYIDRSQSVFNPQLLAEIMSSAICIIIEKIRLQDACWDQIMNCDGLEEGSISQAVYYFSETLGWDLSEPETVSRCARKFFDQRMI